MEWIVAAVQHRSSIPQGKWKKKPNKEKHL